MEQKKPLIGITCNYDPRDLVGISSQHGAVGQDWNFVTGDYVYALEKAGASPVLIQRCSDFENLLPLLNALDGILITGGADVAPACYGEIQKSYCGPVFPCAILTISPLPSMPLTMTSPSSAFAAATRSSTSPAAAPFIRTFRRTLSLTLTPTI